MQFINAPIGHHNDLAIESHSQAYYTSRLLDFTSKQLNEILESEDSQACYASYFTINETVNKRPVSEDLDDCLINDMKSLDENTSKKLNEREDSQASVKVSK
ncbi:15357_t:CDS:2 [Rhizophagus irregularis]|nr:15357_t:CDS:2 [Rhizophagus irregularis]